jgi:hypothetical protein
MYHADNDRFSTRIGILNLVFEYAECPERGRAEFDDNCRLIKAPYSIR